MGRTTRRQLLDKYLEDARKYMKGRVLDVGGKKESKRGNFRPPLEQVDKWEYLNVDETTNPDYCCSAEDIPLEPNSIDTVLLVEVLEHVESPKAVLREISRILKPGGKLILSMPFIYPIHPDPSDFQRYTDSKLQKLLNLNGIKIIEMRPMGYYFTVLADILYLGIKKSASRLLRRLCLVLFYIIKPFLFKLDNGKKSRDYKGFTTGFFVVGEKLENEPK